MFSGFCFKDETELFSSLAPIDELYSLSGFSYGAILAFKEALKQNQKGRRIQNLYLFSPAFFQDRSTSFIKAQIRAFKTNPHVYIQNFLSRCGNPPKQFFKQGNIEELEELLTFRWQIEDLEFLKQSGIEIRVYLGGKDQIINPQAVRDFFSPFALIYFYPKLNHLLLSDHL